MIVNREIAVHPTRLAQFAQEVLVALGAPGDQAAIVADHLIGAHLAGHDSHGVQLLPYYAELVTAGSLDPAASPEIVIDSGALSVVDGRNGWGQVTARWATDLVGNRVAENGVACVLGRRASHVGRLGEYTSRLADRGLFGLMFVGSGGGAQIVAPFGGRERRLSNNPLSLAAPSERGPVVADMALSTVAEGKLAIARDKGEPVPIGWIADSNGEPTTDPEEYFDGGHLLPAAGHKGSSLIVLSDILAGILSGGGAARPNPPVESNTFAMIAIDTRQLRQAGEYESEMQLLREFVVGCPRLPGVERIYFPGELEAESATARAEGIPVPEGTLRRLRVLTERLGVPPLT